MSADPMPSDMDLQTFFQFMYEQEEGLVYIATKVPETGEWTQKFFDWPEKQGEIVSYVDAEQKNKEVYFAPALFKEPDANKINVKGANVLWCEFDGKVPTELGDVPAPSLKIQSSGSGREHWYWKLEGLTLPYDLERINRRITYAFGADTSGWDAGQVLRPVGTYNHKRKRKVQFISKTSVTVSISDFVSLKDPPPAVVTEEIPKDIPDVADVIANNKFDLKTWDLFKMGRSDDRSRALSALGYGLAELGLNPAEMLAMLLDADRRWGKYHNRSDQLQRLMEIVIRAKAKHPTGKKQQEEEQIFYSMGLQTLLSMEIQLEWIWEGLLQKRGFFLLTGPSGVGKTQFSLDAAANFVLSDTYLGRKVPETPKIGFFSLEMGLVDLKFFLEQQAHSYTPEQLSLLEKHMRLFPIGEPVYLNHKAVTEKIERTIELEQLDGIIFDSLGSTTSGGLSKEEDIRQIMDWNDQIRQRTGVFTWFIHHHRKASSDNKKPDGMADVFGSQYITARATTVLSLWPSAKGASLSAVPLKVRLAAKPPAFDLYRDTTLKFTHIKPAIAKMAEAAAGVDIDKELEESETGVSITNPDPGLFLSIEGEEN